MEFGEYWLLETAVTGGISFRLINRSPEDLWDQWNKPPHGLSRDELANTLDRLFRGGDIVADLCSPRLSKKTNRCLEPELLLKKYVPTREEVFDAIKKERSVSDQSHTYWLTAQGGRRWEENARADWSRYFSQNHGGEVFSLTCGTAERRQYLLDHVEWMWEMEIDPRTFQFSTVEPWQATYWKTLDRGYRVDFAYRDRDPNEATPESLRWLLKFSREEAFAAWQAMAHEFWHWHEGFRPANP